MGDYLKLTIGRTLAVLAALWLLSNVFGLSVEFQTFMKDHVAGFFLVVLLFSVYNYIVWDSKRFSRQKEFQKKLTGVAKRKKRGRGK